MFMPTNDNLDGDGEKIVTPDNTVAEGSIGKINYDKGLVWIRSEDGGKDVLFVPRGGPNALVNLMVGDRVRFKEALTKGKPRTAETIEVGKNLQIKGMTEQERKA